MLLGTLLPLAAAATVTEIPPFLRGDVELGYTYDRLAGSLEERGDEGDVVVAQRALQEHALSYGVVFGAGPGVAVVVRAPHYLTSSVSYDELGQMVYDPSTGSGTYQDAISGTPGVAVSGSGLGGVWLGVRGTPFSEAFVKRQNRATWLLEGAVRTPDASNFWTLADGKERGAGPGGTALRIHSAFSTTFGSSQPYLLGTWTAEGPRTVDLYGTDGAKLASGVEIDPANTAHLRTGVEVLASENAASGGRTAFDMHVDVNYATWSTVQSGTYLPLVLEDGRSQAVQQAEAMEAGAGIGLSWRPMAFMQLDLYGDFAWHMPQRIEHPYPVYTGEDTLHLTAGSRLTVRIR